MNRLIISILFVLSGYAAGAETVKPERVRIVDCGSDYLRDGDGRPNHQFHVHRWSLVKDEATGLWNVGPRVETNLNADVDGDGRNDDDAVAYHEFSLTRPFSPEAPWYDSLSGSPRWYGGAAIYQADRRDTGFSEDGVNHEHDGPMYLPRDNWALFHETYEINSPYRLGAVWVWKKEDFLNGGDRYRVSFDDRSELALYLQRYFMCVDGVRFVIQDGEQFYVSEQIFQGAGQQRGLANGKQHVLCPANTRWAEYHPNAPHDIWFDVSKAQFEKHDFQDVRAVGVYVFKDRFIPSYFGYKWYAFEADAVVHRPAQPSWNLDMTGAAPGLYITAGPVPYLKWKNIFRLARSNTFVRDPRGYIFDRDGDMGAMDADSLPHSPQEPVTDLTLHDAIAWCNALSELEGKTPCYYEDADFQTVFRYVLRSPMYGPQRALPELHVKWDADGYRLPVAAEWSGNESGLWVVRRDAGLPAPKGDRTPQFRAGPVPAARSSVTDPVLEMVKVPGLNVEFAKYETTYAQWKTVRDWALANGYRFDADGDMGSMDYWGMADGWGAARPHSPDEPVTDITYYDAAAWCNALSEIEGRIPVYYEDQICAKVYRTAFIYRPLMQLFFETDEDQAAGRLPRDRMLTVGKIYAKTDADGYRLPTTEEYTKAAGGGTDDKTRLERAWLFDNSEGTTRPAGRKQPNEYGLYDIEGNVSELCMGSAPAWDIISGVGVVPRCGGSFTELTAAMNSIQPQRTPVGWGYPDTGFRAVRQTGRQQAKGRAPWWAWLSALVPEAAAAELPVAKSGKTDAVIQAADVDLLEGRVARGSLLRDGVVRSAGPARLSALKWKFQTGGPVKSSPVVVDGTVYFGSNDGCIYAVEAGTGKEIWKVKTDGKVTGAAAVVNDTVYIPSESGVMYAVSAKSGVVKWQTPLGSDKPCGAAAVINGVVLIGAGAGGGSETATMTGRPVVGLDAATGAKVWQAAGGPQGYAAVCTDGRTVFAGNNGHFFSAYDLDTGKALWSQIPGHQDRQFGTMAKSGDTVYFAGSMAGSVNAHDAAAGKRLWMTYTCPDQVIINNGGEPGYEILGSPAVAHGLVYVGCNDGKLHTFGAKDGARGWTFSTGGPVQSSPTIAGMTVYFGSHDGHLYAVDALTGEELGRFKTGGKIVSTPWPDNGTVYVGSDDGSLYAIN